MKITRAQLRKLVKEEAQKLQARRLHEVHAHDMADTVMDHADQMQQMLQYYHTLKRKLGDETFDDFIGPMTEVYNRLNEWIQFYNQQY